MPGNWIRSGVFSSGVDAARSTEFSCPDWSRNCNCEWNWDGSVALREFSQDACANCPGLSGLSRLVSPSVSLTCLLDKVLVGLFSWFLSLYECVCVRVWLFARITSTHRVEVYSCPGQWLWLCLRLDPCFHCVLIGFLYGLLLPQLSHIRAAPYPPSISLLSACFDILLLSQCLFIFDAAIKLQCGMTTSSSSSSFLIPTPIFFWGWTFCAAVNMSIFLPLWLLLLFMISMTQIKFALSSWVFRFAFMFCLDLISFWCTFVRHFLRYSIYIFLFSSDRWWIFVVQHSVRLRQHYIFIKCNQQFSSFCVLLMASQLD